MKLVDLLRQHRSIAPEINAAITRVIESTTFILGEEVELFEISVVIYRRNERSFVHILSTLLHCSLIPFCLIVLQNLQGAFFTAISRNK